MFWILDILFRYVQSLLLFPFLPGRQAWDLAVDICLSQLPEVIENPMIFKVFGSPEKCCFVCHFLDFVKKHFFFFFNKEACYSEVRQTVLWSGSVGVHLYLRLYVCPFLCLSFSTAQLVNQPVPCTCTFFSVSISLSIFLFVC